MCTVTWVHRTDGYQLLCNRDERRTRAQAVPPAVHMRDGVRFIAPIDGDFGGTWIATNEFGLSVCLLNGPRAAGDQPRLSRGVLVLKLISAFSPEEVDSRIQEIDLGAFPSFTIAVLQAERPAHVTTWTGAELKAGDSCTRLLTSSSYDPDGVRAERLRGFQRCIALEPDGESLRAFHESHSPQGGAYSVCMHREDAETVSFASVEVTKSEVSFFYTPAAPCRRWGSERKTLEIRNLA
jgi:hypothetical protein